MNLVIDGLIYTIGILSHPPAGFSVERFSQFGSGLPAEREFLTSLAKRRLRTRLASRQVAALQNTSGSAGAPTGVASPSRTSPSMSQNEDKILRLDEHPFAVMM